MPQLWQLTSQGRHKYPIRANGHRRHFSDCTVLFLTISPHCHMCWGTQTRRWRRPRPASRALVHEDGPLDGGVALVDLAHAQVARLAAVLQVQLRRTPSS